MPKKRTRINCTFCGDEDVESHVEHVFPEWLIRKLAYIAQLQHPDSPPTYKDYTYTHLAAMQADVETFRTNADPGPADRLAEKVTTTGAIPSAYKLPEVCDRCNGGWMAGLEEATKRLLNGLLMRDRRELAPFDQLIIATWAVKTCLTYDASREPRLIPDDAGTRELFRLGYPLPGVQVLLGNDPDYNPDGALVHGRGFLRGPSLRPDMHIIKFVFQFDLVLFSVLIPFGSASGHVVHETPNRPYFATIWPPQQRRFVWPSDEALVPRRSPA